MFCRPTCLTNARVMTTEGVAQSIRFASRVLDVGAGPRRGDEVIDVDGGLVWPGLINAHDHLELNHYGLLKGRDAYRNASEWIEDMRPRLQRDPAIRAARVHSLADRLFIGGLKNLLSGVTTVAHHNPYYAELRFWFPIRVVDRYGWAHSFFLQRRPAGANGEPGGDIAERYRSTPSDRPFFLHLGEGTDEEARGELGRLEAMGCLGDNTVLVHGVALDDDDWRRMIRRGASLVWCPSSNRFLFGRSAGIRRFLDAGGDAAGRISLGSDSRSTGARDLLDEMRVATEDGPASPAEVVRMVTTSPARALRLAEAGRIASGLPADLIVTPSSGRDPYASLLAATRRSLKLVAVGGRPLVADPDLAGAFAGRRSRARLGKVDGAVKLFDEPLAQRLACCAIGEPGVECDGAMARVQSS